MSFKSRFLKSDEPGVVNTVKLVEVGTGRSLTFHPFIEAFDHTVEPNIVEEKYGLFGAVSNHRAGFGVERYTITLVLPAVDGESAERNYNQIERLMRVINPTRRDLLSSDALYRLTVSPLIRKTLRGHITSVSEQHDLDAGFINGYPKVMRVTFTFTVDKLLEQLGRAPKAPSRAAAQAEAANNAAPFPKNMADQAVSSEAKGARSVGPDFSGQTPINQSKKDDAKPLPGAKKIRIITSDTTYEN